MNSRNVEMFFSLPGNNSGTSRTNAISPAMKKSHVILFVLFLMLIPTVGQASYTIASNILYINGADAGYQSIQPGDTLYFAGGNKDYLLIKNFRGAPGKPIVMINSGDPIIIDTDFYYGISIQNCQYIKFTGTGDPTQTYGFQVNRVANGAGLGIGYLSSDFEVDHISIQNTLIAGVYAKTDPDCTLTSVRGTFTQYNTIFHDNYIAYTGNEGLYIGSTKYDGETVTCNGKDTVLMPSLLDGVQVYNNIVKYSGWDGIQVSSAYRNCKIYNNTVLYDSQAGAYAQMSGIIMGGGTRADCFNNFIAEGKGDGIECHGLGGCRIFNNIILDAGRSYAPTDSTQMKYGMYVTDVSVEPDSSFYIQNNNIINPKSEGIRFSSLISKNNLIASNVIINPGAFNYYQNGNTHFKGIDSYIMFQNTGTSVTLQNNYLARTADSVRFVSSTFQSPKDFKLLAGSPVIDHAVVDPRITFDFTGSPRPYGAKSDIGAFEFEGDTTAVISPVIQNITGGGAYCAGNIGVPVGLEGSQTGVKYQVVINGTNTGSAIVGTGSALNFGPQTLAGTYTVYATDTILSLTSAMAGSVAVTVNRLPALFAVVGGGPYCPGGTGVLIGLSGSQSGINYQLILNGTNIGTILPGTGSAINFGYQTGFGTYTVIGTDATSSCTNAMIGSATVSLNAIPSAPANITGTVSACVGSTTTLTNSTSGGVWISSSPSVAAVSSAGIVTGISSGTAAIAYSVSNAGGCSASTSTTVTINALPTNFSVTGGGVNCTGGTGVAIGVSGSQTGVNYQLKLAGVNTGTAVAGNGNPISFGLKTTAGSYTVTATNTTTTCSSTMTGSAAIIVSALPSAPASISGTKSICIGSTTTLGDSTTGGVWSSLSPSIATVTSAGIVTGISAGTATIRYTITNGGGCSNSSNTTVTVNALPTPFTLTGGGSYCAGGTGVAVGLNSSLSGVKYQLALNGVNTGSAVSGTSSAISFGIQTAAGTYTVTGTNTNTTCSTAMTGSASVSVNALPSAPAAIAGNTSVCMGYTAFLTDATTPGFWSTSAPAVATVSTTGVVTGVVGGTATIRYTVTNNSGCANSTSTTVTVNSPPVQPGKFTASATKVSLGQSNVPFTVPLVSGVTYKWSYSGTGATITGTSNSVLVSFSSTATSGILSVTASNGCGTSTARTVAINGLKSLTIPLDTSQVAAVIVAQGANLELTSLTKELKIYPNPNVGVANFDFQIDKSGQVKLEIFSIMGQYIARIFDAEAEAGIVQTVLYQHSLPTGVYYCVMRWSGKMMTSKLIVLR